MDAGKAHGVIAIRMKILLSIGVLFSTAMFAAPTFTVGKPILASSYQVNAASLCATANETLAYLNKGAGFDPAVIHAGRVAPVPLWQVKATLVFICQHQSMLKNPEFINKHFDFIHWQPDMQKVRSLSAHKPLLKNLPADQILMTKYYVHLAKASSKATAAKPYALYALPQDEQALTLEDAEKRPDLIRHKYGKQAILTGVLHDKAVPVLAYLSRDDLESALLQGTVVADFGGKTGKKIFNVHRNNNISYDRTQAPYAQQRYWYFKEVDGIKGYGKDADHKITVNPDVTFAADLNQFGLGKLLLVQYADKSRTPVIRLGILADTGGAFADNLYQVDFLAGSYAGKQAHYQATRHLPDYVNAYFMVLKKEYCTLYKRGSGKSLPASL